MKSSTTKRWAQAIVCGLGLVALTATSGCQVTSGGQTLPSPYYTTDDVQFHPPGPEFKLSREAAAIKAHQADLQQQGR